MSFEFVGSVELFGAAHMSPEGTLVLLEGFVDQHVSLYFVLPVERGLTDGAFIRLLS